jgi:hypothetical protein
VKTPYRSSLEIRKACKQLLEHTRSVTLTHYLTRANAKSARQSETVQNISAEESTPLGDRDDVSSLDEYSDDDYDTDEEVNLINIFPKISATPQAPENTPGSTLSKPDILDGAMLPLQMPFIDAVVSEWLQTRFGGPAPGIRSLAGSEQTNSSSAISSSSGGGPSEVRGNGGGRKRILGDDQPFERSSGRGQDGNGDDPNKRQKGNPSTNSVDSWKVKRYACPYYQREPKLYGHRRSCIGPGWSEVHRVK